MKNRKTDLMAYLKIALGAVFVWLKLHNNQPLTDSDYILLGALGLGAAGSKVSADAGK